jgi:hypothetical protein
MCMFVRASIFVWALHLVCVCVCVCTYMCMYNAVVQEPEGLQPHYVCARDAKACSGSARAWGP